MNEHSTPPHSAASPSPSDPPVSAFSAFEPPVVRMKSPADMADALPYLLGFYPSDSVVALGLQGSRRRQGGSVRVDIPASSAWPAAAEEVVGFLLALSEQRDRPPDAVILYLCQDPELGGSPRAVAERLRPLASLLAEGFAAAGVPVHESLCVSQGRWFSYTCTDSACCPAEGALVRPPGSTSAVAAAAAFAGIQVRGSLRDMHRELEPVVAEAAGPLLQAFEREMPAISAELAREGGRERLREATAALVDAAVLRFGRGDRELDDHDAARIVFGLQDRLTRDRAAEWLDPPDVAHAATLWRYLARRCVGPFADHAAAPLSLLGWTAWVTGDTVTARVALGRALAVDPTYTFANLLYEAINCGAVPDTLCATLRAERAARIRRGGRRRRGRLPRCLGRSVD
ncbi:DUF4192 domain-containing protein [Streptacidiphilus jiangxiensis]|uniref:DUF4192 domain-containing protein n=1 Tax=Streptacidiphilus jiangxiensis TaxID=235985 RepID=A0A1H7KMQ6_STRJI|nr:DUF4192 domain-containing protein [Streptacidiphilus jiangxiensis]SEK87814.1 protein of unknown function [Streptacidiphilus jiangxiensis]